MKKSRFSLWIKYMSIGVVTLHVITPCGFCFDVEKMKSPESNTVQSLKGDDIISPYRVTGESLVKLIQKMADFKVPGSSIIFNRRTGQIFVRNTPTNHDMIKTILAELRKAQYKQIDIEARIITVSATDLDDLGLDYLGVSGNGSYQNKLLGTQSSIGSGDHTTFSDFPSATDAAGSQRGGQLSFGALAPKFEIDAYIDMLSSRAEVNTVSAPHIVVANNQRANIRLEKAQYYIQKLEADVRDDTNDSLAIDPEIGVAQSGTILDVTPTVNADNTISLELHPQFVTADLTDTQDINMTAALGVDAIPSITLPVFKVQSADTTLTVENGGVAVIGGLIEESEVRGAYKVPVLGDIPLIGKLCFQKNKTEDVKTHLLIFVKATVKNAESVSVK